MMKILTSDIALRFFGGFAVGCVLVLSGAPDLLRVVA